MAIPIKVLCVDDDPDMAESTARLLGLLGCDARACCCGTEALRVAASFQPEVCLLDLSMPGMGGEELAIRLQEQAGGRSVRCIALTGRWDIDARHDSHNAGFVEHLVKPVTPERLLEAVTGMHSSSA